MDTKKQIVSFLFSDVKGYSALAEHEYKLFDNAIEDFLSKILTDSNHFFQKNWGDGLYICSYDPLDIAEISLEIRDKFRNYNWIRNGFLNNLSVRIALHTEKATIKSENGIIKDVYGKNVTKAARIEPITEPNHVFCSYTFHNHIISEENINYNFISLGVRQLAKQFGKMELYELLRDYESRESKNLNDDLNIPKISIKRKANDFEKQKFKENTYNIIINYFKKALEKVELENDDISVSVNQVNKFKFQFSIYLSGELKSGCQIWIGDSYNSNSILFSSGLQFSDGSYNESLNIEHNGYNFFIKPLMNIYNNGEIFKESKFAAEYLWKKFVEPLHY